jgi:Flp pilus assembly pilin Flp
MPALLRRLSSNRDGAALVEYSLLVLLVAIAMISALTQTGQGAANGMGNVGNGFN